ncbi:MAG TPA: YjfB family protein [Bacillota bacterium]|nr:YjfB family protein [Bacillota bacterium]
MDVTSAATTAIGMKNENIQQAYQMSLLRNSLDQKALSSQKLLEALPEAKPANLGRNLDVRF